jgi:Heavy metal binding domain
MKNILFIALILTSLMACQNATTPKTDAVETTKPAPTTATEVKTDTTHAPVFACPMDLEITGKEGDKCSKCGMALVRKD